MIKRCSFKKNSFSWVIICPVLTLLFEMGEKCVLYGNLKSVSLILSQNSSYTVFYKNWLKPLQNFVTLTRGRSRYFEKGGGSLYVGHHGWPTKKLLGFRWSKKVKITLETKAFGETLLSVFSIFLHFYIQ